MPSKPFVNAVKKFGYGINIELWYIVSSFRSEDRISLVLSLKTKHSWMNPKDKVVEEKKKKEDEEKKKKEDEEKKRKKDFYTEFDEWKIQKANLLAQEYDKNSSDQLAFSLVSYAILEISEPSGLLVEVRSNLIDIFGKEESNEAYEVYDKVIEIIEKIKEEYPMGKMTESYMLTSSVVFAAKATGLSIENSYNALKIRVLSEKIYNERVLKIKKPFGGGSGASGKYK